MELSGWGRFPVVEARCLTPRNMLELKDMVRAEPSLVARGNGRAYGDAGISQSATIGTRHLNHMRSFDASSGLLIAEAGVLLGDIIDAFLPRGWFPLVTPGTKFVTLGGAIAADVHGKNHHIEGSFRSCVDWVEVMGRDGSVTRCAPGDDLFEYTLGGMGLTGVITCAAIRLRPVETAWISQQIHPAPNLRAAMDVFEAHHHVTYSVAWIDCLATGADAGRSLVMLGEHATRDELPAEQRAIPLDFPRKKKRLVPFDFPAFALNSWSVRAFNAFYYRSGARKDGRHLVDWDSYFYPLDAILEWNRIYGRKGFAQFQCVVPLANAEAGILALLNAISSAGEGSFLAVLKRFGKQDSAFSFPMEGYTLALDFPINPKTLALMETLDRITIEHGGRFYLAKDSRMTAATFAASESRLTDMQTKRAEQNWLDKFNSAQSERLSL